MQIVIDIDDNLYTRLFDNGDEYVADMRRACVAIRKGTPLVNLPTDEVMSLFKDVHELPPVNPQPKTGYWIRMKAYEKWGCSECNTVFRFTFKEHNYCPNCGAKMVKEDEQDARK